MTQLGLFSSDSNIVTSHSIIAREYIPESEYYFHCDLETTGFEFWRSSVIEIAFVVTDKHLNKIDEFVTTARPVTTTGRGYDPKTEKIHGYCFEELLQFKTQREACLEILHFLKKYLPTGTVTRPFIYHANGSFDWTFLYIMFQLEGLNHSLDRFFGPSSHYSTMKLARMLGYFIPKKDQVPVIEGGDGDGLGLKVLSKMINFPLVHHRALSDTDACYYILRYFFTGKKYGEV